GCWPGRVFLLGGANLDEDKAFPVHRHNVELALGTAIIAGDNAIAQSFQEGGRGALRTAAKPASPPGLNRRLTGHVEAPLLRRYLHRSPFCGSLAIGLFAAPLS